MAKRYGEAFKAKSECYLKHFWEEPLSEPTMQQAELYLIKVVIDYKSTCRTFDELRYKIYTSKENCLQHHQP